MKHDPGFIKTRYEVKGATVYKKNKRYYHRDTMHRGAGAELEVYDKRGRHIGTADPLTGEFNPNNRVPGRSLRL